MLHAATGWPVSERYVSTLTVQPSYGVIIDTGAAGGGSPGQWRLPIAFVETGRLDYVVLTVHDQGPVNKKSLHHTLLCESSHIFDRWSLLC